MIDVLLDKLAWPGATVLIACFAIVAFRRSLSPFFGGLKIKYGQDGLSVEGASPSNQAEPKTTEPGLNLPTKPNTPDTLRIESVRSFGVSAIVSQGERAIRADLQQIGVSPNTQEASDILIRQLAVTQQLHRSEKIYRNIFGSQIEILHRLNLFGIVTRDNLMESYRAAKAQFPHAYSTYSEERHLKFLESWGLIGSTDGDTYQITLAGKEFLSWMTAEGIGSAKSF